MTLMHKHYSNRVFWVVVGSGIQQIAPITKQDAAISIGIVGCAWINSPNICVPKMAPILATLRSIPLDVVLIKANKNMKYTNTHTNTTSALK